MPSPRSFALIAAARTRTLSGERLWWASPRLRQRLQAVQGLAEQAGAGWGGAGQGIEPLPFQQLHHQEGAAVRGEARVEDRRKTRVPEPREGRGQPSKSGAVREPRRGAHGDQLDRDRPARLAVGRPQNGPGPVDFRIFSKL